MDEKIHPILKNTYAVFSFTYTIFDKEDIDYLKSVKVGPK